MLEQRSLLLTESYTQKFEQLGIIPPSPVRGERAKESASRHRRVALALGRPSIDCEGEQSSWNTWRSSPSFADHGFYHQVDTIYTLCEWQLVDAERFRKLVKNDEDAQIWVRRERKSVGLAVSGH